jgi:PAS domain-containing protein
MSLHLAGLNQQGFNNLEVCKIAGYLFSVDAHSTCLRISCDLCNAIVSANPAVETVFGFKQAELIGHCIGLLIPILVESKSTFRDIVDDGKPKTEINEVVGRHKNGYSVCPWSFRKLSIRLMTSVIL